MHHGIGDRLIPMGARYDLAIGPKGDLSLFAQDGEVFVELLFKVPIVVIITDENPKRRRGIADGGHVTDRVDTELGL